MYDFIRREGDTIIKRVSLTFGVINISNKQERSDMKGDMFLMPLPLWMSSWLLLLLSCDPPSTRIVVMAAITFEGSAIIECTGLETVADELPAEIQNCSFFGVNDAQRLCSFSPGCDKSELEALANLDQGASYSTWTDCDYDEQSGNVSTVRYVFVAPDGCTHVQCGDDCSGKSEVIGILASPETTPLEMCCPPPAVTTDSSTMTNASSSCTTAGDYGDANYTSTTTNSSGTYYTIHHAHVGAVCDKECIDINAGGSGASSYMYSSWGRSALFSSLLCLVLSTCIAAILGSW